MSRGLGGFQEARLTVRVGNDAPKLSAVEPAYNRAETCGEMLRHLAEQSSITPNTR